MNKHLSKLLSEHIDNRKEYYRQKIIKNIPIEIILLESWTYQEEAILKHLIVSEFPVYEKIIQQCLLIS